jgi:Tfp pilus assembly protein PilF
MVSALAAAALLLAVTDEVHAATLVVGGLAGQCSNLARAGKHDPDSLDVCTQALSASGLSLHDMAGTYVNRGSMELGARLNEDANGDFRHALKLAPRMGEAHVGEGAYLVSQERFAEAEAEISQGLSLGSEQPEKAYYFRAVARWGQNDFKGAYADFNRAIALKPGWDLPREQLKNFHVETRQ